MAVNAYLYVDGVTGPSTSKTGFIDILSFSIGVYPILPLTARGFRSGSESRPRRSFQSLDHESPRQNLAHAFQSLLLRRHSEEGLHPVRQARRHAQADYFRVYLPDALITSVQHPAATKIRLNP